MGYAERDREFETELFRRIVARDDEIASLKSTVVGLQGEVSLLSTFAKHGVEVGVVEFSWKRPETRFCPSKLKKTGCESSCWLSSQEEALLSLRSTRNHRQNSEDCDLKFASSRCCMRACKWRKER